MTCCAIAAVALAAILAGSPAPAGPWPREDGAVFLSVSTRSVASTDGALSSRLDSSFYLEWGVTERLTFGANIYTGDGRQETTAEAFAILPLPLPERWGVASVSGGIGARQQQDGSQDTLASAGLAWGLPLDKGWASVETRVLFDLDTRATQYKLDATLGYAPTDRLSLMVQLQAGDGSSGDSYARIEPSVLLRLSDRVRVNLGVTQDLSGSEETGVFVGTWLDF